MIHPASPDNINKAARLIRNGGLVAFPTETVYGLGANAFNPAAVEKIFAIKKRPHFDPLIVHLADQAQVESVAEVDCAHRISQLQKLSAFWPGPLSVVLPRKSTVPAVVTAGLPSVAVRVPSHPVCRAFLRACALPVAAPSANPFGYVSPTSATHVEKYFSDSIEMILDGGDCPVGLESTIISLLGEIPLLLRHGAVTLEMLRAALGDVQEGATGSAGENPTAPGMLKEHYAPRTPVVLRQDIKPADLPGRTGLITFNAQASSQSDAAFSRIIALSAAGDLEEVARGLFAALHEMDGLKLDLIVVDSCENRGLGRAIMVRLTRAAAKS